jgi:hypothetical protein
MVLAFIRVLLIRVDTFFPKRSLGKDVVSQSLNLPRKPLVYASLLPDLANWR